MRIPHHVTPRYVLDRVRQAGYRRRHPELPWLTRDAIALLDQRLRGGRGFEWGSGTSSIWLAQRLDHLTTVESDPVWHERVQQRANDAGLGARMTIMLEPTDEDDSRGAEAPYVRAIDTVPDRSLDFVLVDGVLRDHCTLGAIPKLSNGALLVLDNANWAIPGQTRAPGSLGVDDPPASATWTAFLGIVAGWEHHRSTNGIWDTSVWVSPG
jgi:predicted O-methyltransferase YrrM